MPKYFISQEDLKSMYTYDPLTGDFTSIRLKRVAGHINNGYVVINIRGISHKAHRLAWLYVHGGLPEADIDHINHIRNDNRIENLRMATRGQNRANTIKRFDGFCEQKGVYFKGGRFGSRMGDDHLGYFDTADEAAHFYNKAAVERFGEFACLNPVGSDKIPAIEVLKAISHGYGEAANLAKIALANRAAQPQTGEK